MTMREANRYSSLFSFVSGKLKSNLRRYSNDTVPLLTSFVFIPLALALKIQNIKFYDRFVSGEGEAIIRDLYKLNPLFRRINVQGTSPNESEAANTAVEAYKSITNTDHNFQTHHNVKKSSDFFKSVLPLLASVSVIDNSKPGNDSR